MRFIHKKNKKKNNFSSSFFIFIPLIGIILTVIVISQKNAILSLMARGAAGGVTCPGASTEEYSVGSIGEPDPNPHANPDTVLSLKGWEPFAGDLNLVTYGYPQGEPPDPKAPQLGTILNNGPAFSVLYQIRNYDPANYKDPPHLAGLTSNVGQIVLAPENGYDIGGGFQYKVIYATGNELTVNVMGSDYAIDGYAMHFADLCVDPNLVSLYQRLHSEGRRFLPAVKMGQKIGVAKSTEVKVAIRDSGSYLDPRSKLDWWQNYSVNPNPTIYIGGGDYPTIKPTRKPKSTPRVKPTVTAILPTSTVPPSLPTVTPKDIYPSPTVFEPTLIDDEESVEEEPTIEEIPEEKPKSFALFENAGKFIGDIVSSIFDFLKRVAP